MSPALSPVRKTSSSTDEKTTNNSTRGDPKNMDKDLILKCAQRKKIKKIEEEQDTDDDGDFTNNHGPVTGKNCRSQCALNVFYLDQKFHGLFHFFDARIYKTE